jgi:N-acetylglucosaminyldiphosphoundecaprenol N-acetyl-beta-D-mannosaminyltransferase
MQKTGLEWLWRIKEENALFRRYWNDGVQFLALLWRNVLPQLIGHKLPDDRSIFLSLSDGCLVVKGSLSTHTVAEFVAEALRLLAEGDLRTMDFSNCTYIDARGIGVLMMLRKHYPNLEILNTPASIGQIFRVNNASYLLA